AAALDDIERIAGADHHAAHAAVAHQQVAAQPQPQQRHLRWQLPEEVHQLGAIAGAEEHIGRTAHMPGGVAGQRLIQTDAGGELRRRQVAHGASCAHSATSRGASSWAAALMLPAPIIAITSPPRTMPASAGAIPSTPGTNTGSTLPRLRTARQIARPSAPSMGSSPAACTSATSSG